MTGKRTITVLNEPDAPHPWVRFTADGFVCQHCKTTRAFRSPDLGDLRRESHDFLLRHKGCPAPPLH